MTNNYRINVCNDEGKVVARVQYNSNLDFWDGRNWTCGSVGRHLGLTKLKKSGNFVLIHGTQWQGERDYAEVISPEQAYQEIIQSENMELLDKYPELKKFELELETEEV